MKMKTSNVKRIEMGIDREVSGVDFQPLSVTDNPLVGAYTRDGRQGLSEFLKAGLR